MMFQSFVIVLGGSLLSLVMVACRVPVAGNAGEPDSPDLRQLRRELSELDKRMKTIKEPPAGEGRYVHGPGDYERVIDAGGMSRRYEFFVPAKYDRARPTPLILNFHGGAGRGATARLESRMDDKAERAGFIVVYPDGTGRMKERFLTWNAGSCCGYSVENRIDDVGFIRALLDDVSKYFNVDRNRIYATGLSNGGMMSHRLACEMADHIAAVATIGGTLGLTDCRPARPISILHFHGTGDQNSPYNGGVGAHSASKVNFRSVPETIQGWVRRNGADGAAPETSKSGDATITTYRAKDGTEVTLVTLAGGGHTWPGGQRLMKQSVVGDISRFPANDVIWQFFQRHPMR